MRHLKFEYSEFIGFKSLAFFLVDFFSLRTGHLRPNYYIHNSTFSGANIMGYLSRGWSTTCSIWSTTCVSIYQNVCIGL